MSDEFTPTDEDVYGVWTNYQCFYADDGYGPRGLEQAAAELDRYLARARRDAALREKQRIAGEVRLWASINDDLGHTETAETLARAARDIDRIPTEDEQ